MRFTLEQRFSSPLEAVESAFVDPALLAELATMPRLGRPELVAQTDGGDTVQQDVRYAFVGDLSPAMTKALDPARLTWSSTPSSTAARTGPLSRSGPITTPTGSPAQAR